ncbi:hypothetical protein [Gynuella sunshinyii]|uniref:Uncharacterized protein n=1 Tax=Gynuella sunshinyii YC6258 TaxID=1445510 RepID=A0A0C5VZH4_9GAMM|nr:hypothetical protein [Gynuella sunshinyii]AJQ92239.1 hypothetical Protein YC6258_00187 [Gynuella sunshinyii YC6258]AJQ95814.1 hypothetical Protein YC6258_03778 [Gynuella sunshinyii YC6258]
MNPMELGDAAALDAMATALEAEGVASAKEGAEQAHKDFQDFEKNNGAGFPYQPAVASALKNFLGMGSFKISQGRGQHWLLEEKEAEQMGIAIAQCVDAYMPDTNSPFTNMVMVCGMAIGPRLALDMMHSKRGQQAQGGAGESNQ